jgi:uncharacterized protein YjlB
VLSTMAQVKKYHLPPTRLIPNSPHPLLHYTGVQLSTPGSKASQFQALFEENDWEVQWINRYGSTQTSHYHSGVHEAMAVLSGNATIRFGAADTSPDMDENTYGSAKEEGGIKIEAHPGDVFLIPAGVAHKTFKTKPDAGFALLTPGDGHHVASDDMRAALDNIELSGFTMIGAYPTNGESWDFVKECEDVKGHKKPWSVKIPERDPVLGKSQYGLCGKWSSESNIK